MAERIRCPNPACPDPFDVYKVSEIVRAGKVSGYVSYGSFASMSSKLVGQLEDAYPSAPPFPAKPRRSFGTALGLTIALGFTLMAITFAVFGGNKSDSPILPQVVVIIVSFVVPGAVVFTLSRLEYRGEVEQYPQALRNHELQMRKYHEAVRRWDSAYYSARCGSMFIAEQTAFKTIDHMRDLLFD